jgi:hypothetical protein
MTAYVEECRQEWKRLGVPDLLAEEMATELESDLAEAQADGVSATEILGESDPRRFAANWASERGLVSEPRPKKHRARFWVGLAVAFVVMFFLVMLLVGGLFATATVSLPPVKSPVRPQTTASVVLPSFAGLNACQAARKAMRLGFTVRIPGHEHGYSCRAVVRAENATVKGGHRTVTLWLRRPRR